MNKILQIHEALSWAKEILNQRALEIVANPVFIQDTPWSKVIRLVTSDGLFYLKIPEESFSYEIKLLDFFQEKHLAFLPDIVAIHHTKKIFLMRDSGVPLRKLLLKDYTLPLASSALQACADLQIACIDWRDELIELGIPDYRLEKLPAIYTNFFTAQENILLNSGLTIAEIMQLKNLSNKFSDLCLILEDFNIPQTLEHGDFHDNNILIQVGTTSEKIIIHDFGDTSIAHPFFSLASFLNSAERHHAIKKTDNNYKMLADSYLKKWQKMLPKISEANLLKALELAYLLRPFVWALSFLRIQCSPESTKFPQCNEYLSSSMKILMRHLQT